ncbi:MAG: hypothetical protein QM811_20305 [Pirellulales bacterium]
MLAALGRIVLNDDARLESAKKLLAEKQTLDAELQLLSLERAGYTAAYPAHAEYLEAAGRRDDLALLSEDIRKLGPKTEIRAGLSAVDFARLKREAENRSR